jgi:hypothetical protein
MESPANESTIDRRASDAASAFGALIRSRRRFLIELEAGKSSCQLGRSLLVAQALGLRLSDVLELGGLPEAACAPELPEVSDEAEAAE